MVADTIPIECIQGLQRLEDLIESVKQAGDFLVNGVMEIPLPIVAVAGLGCDETAESAELNKPPVYDAVEFFPAIAGVNW